jgi:hypothetical protein
MGFVDGASRVGFARAVGPLPFTGEAEGVAVESRWTGTPPLLGSGNRSGRIGFTFETGELTGPRGGAGR